MQTTIKQQIKAVQKELAEHKLANKRYPKQSAIDGRPEQIKALNDAASTLAAVNMIGVEKIHMIPQMMEAIQLAVFLAPQSMELQNLNDKLKQL